MTTGRVKCWCSGRVESRCMGCYCWSPGPSKAYQGSHQGVFRENTPLLPSHPTTEGAMNGTTGPGTARNVDHALRPLPTRKSFPTIAGHDPPPPVVLHPCPAERERGSPASLHWPDPTIAYTGSENTELHE